MKKNLYSLFVLGTMLFWVACSDNDTSVAGSTEDPNMRNPSTFNRQSCASIRSYVDGQEGDTILVAQNTCFVVHQNPLNSED